MGQRYNKRRWNWAMTRSRSVLGWKGPSVVIGKFAPSVFGALVGYAIVPDAGAAARLGTVMAGIVGGNLISMGALLGFYWLVAPACMDAEKQAQIDALNHRLDAQRKPPLSDWPIKDLFLHIDPYLPRYSYQPIENIIGDEILSGLINGRISAWGRKQDGNDQLIPVPTSFWETAKWLWLDFSIAGSSEIDAVSVNNQNDIYRDIHVNKNQARLEWPKSRAPVLPDFVKWDKRSTLKVFQAACLWAETEPPPDFPSWPSPPPEQVYRTILEPEYAAGKLPVTANPGAPYRFKEPGYRANNPGRLNPQSTVSRQALLGLDRAKGDRPKFLFPERR